MQLCQAAHIHIDSCRHVHRKTFDLNVIEDLANRSPHTLDNGCHADSHQRNHIADRRARHNAIEIHMHHAVGHRIALHIADQYHVWVRIALDGQRDQLACACLLGGTLCQQVLHLHRCGGKVAAIDNTRHMAGTPQRTRF